MSHFRIWGRGGDEERALRGVSPLGGVTKNLGTQGTKQAPFFSFASSLSPRLTRWVFFFVPSRFQYTGAKPQSPCHSYGSEWDPASLKCPTSAVFRCPGMLRYGSICKGPTVSQLALVAGQRKRMRCAFSTIGEAELFFHSSHPPHMANCANWCAAKQQPHLKSDSGGFGYTRLCMCVCACVGRNRPSLGVYFSITFHQTTALLGTLGSFPKGQDDSGGLDF